MPSPAHAADLERVLTRAAEECGSGSAWFGQGLPRALRSALEAAGRRFDPASAEVAFVDAGEAPTSTPPSEVGRVVALSAAGLDELPSLVATLEAASFPVARVVCPIAVFDFVPEGLRVREIRRGLTAADLQQKLSTTLWSGPDLKEL